MVLHPDGSGTLAVLGVDLAAGMRPQLLIPGGTWHASRVRPGGADALLGTTEGPGFDLADLEIGERSALLAAYPQCDAQILEFMA
jgi:uncharacterized protein